MKLDQPEPRGKAGDEVSEPLRASTWFAITVAAGVGALVIWRALIAPPPPPPPAAPTASASATATASAAPQRKTARCAEIAHEAMIIGDAPKAGAKREGDG